jgi:2-methylaconitate cis-trans-isomerase PrpF
MSEIICEVPVRVIRGGTSKGVYLREADMPADVEDWGPFLLALMGGGDPQEIDGLGGGQVLTSKACIINPSAREDADVDYTFAQVGVAEETVWWGMNCGNLSAGVGYYAVLEGLVEVAEPVTRVRVYQSNTDRLLAIEVPVVDGVPQHRGSYAIDGVPGAGAKIAVDLSQTEGAVFKHGLFPTGSAMDKVYVEHLGKAIECSIVDLASLCVFFRASDVGLSGVEGPEASDALWPMMMSIRTAAHGILNIDDGRPAPYPVMISPAQAFTSATGVELDAAAMHFHARLHAMPRMHAAFPGTSGCCTAIAAVSEGTIVSEVFHPSDALTRAYGPEAVVLAHPAGVMPFDASVEQGANGIVPVHAAFGRTARSLLSGSAYVDSDKVAYWRTKLANDATVMGVPESVQARHGR